jgi:hypothetical protein
MTNWFYNLIYGKKDKEIVELKKQIPNLNPKEAYYNDKYPKLNLTYQRIETDGTYNVDLREFINPFNVSIPIINENEDDEIALQGLCWVIDNIKYISDISEYKSEEYWAYAYQTLFHKQGDCEDGAFLLYNILLKSGVPYWKLRLSAGYVINPNNNKKEGHCYVTYYCETTDKWVVLDWCWFPNRLEITDRKDYKEEKTYGDVWFSWNQKYCYSQGLNTGAQRMLNLK